MESNRASRVDEAQASKLWELEKCRERTPRHGNSVNDFPTIFISFTFDFEHGTTPLRVKEISKMFLINWAMGVEGFTS
ncbi:hypothetical protein TNCV_3995841 [Trichonephila clavipes]|nr:hypothetical protein TNCV_3995841 [Trichonephila clavipes]